MRSMVLLTALVGFVSARMVIKTAGAHFSVADPGGVDNVIAAKMNTLDGVYHINKTKVMDKMKMSLRGPMPLHIVNRASSDSIRAYVTGLDSDNKVVFVRANGSVVYPSSGGSRVPVPIDEDLSIALPGDGRSIDMALPSILTSGRIYFADGSLSFFMVKTPRGDGLVQPSPTNPRDPSSSTTWGLVELTYGPRRGVYANISYVDFVGIILGLSLSVTDGRGKQTTRGLGAGAIGRICSALASQSSSDSYPWGLLCVADAEGTPIRALSPAAYSTIDATAFGTYWDAYVESVWSQYSRENLTMDTQSAAGKVSCRVSGTKLTCEGDNRGYAKPTASDIWGCSTGPFEQRAGDNSVHLAIIPRLCAAFVRSTLLHRDGNVQPGPHASQYYTTSPTNHYSRLVHKHEADGKGYAFAYDDVTPNGGVDASGLVASESPDTLTVYVGASP